MIVVKSESKSYGWDGIMMRALLVLILISFVVYGAFYLFAKPTVETVVTPAPHIDANNQAIRDVDYHPAKKFARHSTLR